MKVEINYLKEFIMCIPHGGVGTKDSGYIDVKPKKHIKRVSQQQFEKGDPDFIDERIFKNKQINEKKSLYNRLFGN